MEVKIKLIEINQKIIGLRFKKILEDQNIYYFSLIKTL